MSASSKKKAKPKAKKAAAKGKAKPKAPAPKKAQKAVAPEEEKPKKVVKEKRAPEAKQSAAKPVEKAARLDLGPPPDATVAARHVDSMHERRARGFSFGELASAGVPLDAARRAGLSLDVRRRSVVEGNVEALKGWLGSPPGGLKKQAAVATAAKKN